MKRKFLSKDCQDLESWIKVGDVNDTRELHNFDTYLNAMYFSAFHNQLQMCQLFLSMGIHIDHTSEQTALMAASLNGFKEMTQYLLLQKANPNILSSNHETALRFASRGKHFEIMELLLQAKAQINLGRSSLSQACRLDHCDVLKFLINHNADPNYKRDETCSTAIVMAIRKNRFQIVQFLLTVANIDLISLDNYSRRNPLSVAAFLGYLDIFKLIFDRDNYTYSSLFTASHAGHLHIVKWIINEGKKIEWVHMKNRSNGFFPIYGAIQNNHIEVVKFLFPLWNFKTCKSLSFLHVAAQCGHLSMLQYLHSLRSNLFSLDDIVKQGIHEEKNVLNMASDPGPRYKSGLMHFNVVKWIVEHRSNIVSYDLFYASSGGNIDIVQFLYQRQGLVSLDTKQNMLRIACSKGHVEVVKWVGKKFKHVGTWLSFQSVLASKHYKVIFQYLFTSKNFNINVKNTDDQSPLDIVYKEGKLDIIKWLWKMGSRFTPKEISELIDNRFADKFLIACILRDWSHSTRQCLVEVCQLLPMTLIDIIGEYAQGWNNFIEYHS